MKNLEIKNITLIDEPETKEAEQIYKKYNKLFCLIFIIPLILFIFVFIGAVFQDGNTIYISNQYSNTGYYQNNNQSLMDALFVCCWIFGILTIIGFFIYKTLMKPYKKLLNLAERNDLIRHEEKIRHKERARLQEEDSVKYTKKDIDKTIKKLKK